ncbi:MAG: IS701 family transposase [Chloroflexota bacterium]
MWYNAIVSSVLGDMMAVMKAGPDPLEDLGAFLEPFASLVRRAENRQALERYTTGLLADLPRKTASDMGRALPGTNGQRLQEFLTRTAWDPAVMDRLRIQHMIAHASVGEGVQVVDDTGLPKKGTHSVGVTRQYSGTLGRVDNCQVLVTSQYVDRVFDWPITAGLYLPHGWAHDRERRAQARVPQDVLFRTKGEIALALVDRGLEAGIPTRAVVADAGYGDQPPLLDGLEVRHLPYLVAVASSVRFRRAEQVEQDPGATARPPYQGRGRPRRTQRLEDRIPGYEAGELVAQLPEDAWQIIAWRAGTKGALVKQASRHRVYRVGYRGTALATQGWLLGERPLPGHQGEARFYFAWGLDDMDLEGLLELAHCRWIVERFYQDAKGELGLDDYEGRQWQGSHRHVALVMLAHCYLALQRTYGEAGVRPPSATPALSTAPPPAPVRGFPPSGPGQHHRASPRRA